MNQPDMFSGVEENSRADVRNDGHSVSEVSSLTERIERSALWAAYGDALGWISELADEKRLAIRTKGTPLTTTVAWKRRIGGRFGVDIELPEGCYSDDTQLRLATSRAIQSDGFDVEAFAKVELPVWLSYALGGGRSTTAAAEHMGNKSSTWWSNKFKGWLDSGGNGAAMRIQPHVWASSSPTNSATFLLDVVRNSICTHSHPNGIMGAVIHALGLSWAVSKGKLPTLTDFLSLMRDAEEIPNLIDSDNQLGFWRSAFEHEAGDFKSAWTKVSADVFEALQVIEVGLDQTSPSRRYEFIVEKLKLREPQRRGSGTLTALAALGLTWCEDSPLEAMRLAANTLGTDTDTIATMAGAIYGAVAESVPLGEVLDSNLLRSESHRLANIAIGKETIDHRYPDLLHWSPPQSRADALGKTPDGKLAVSGLGLAKERNNGTVFANSDRFGWQWIELDFGQSLLIKRRKTLPEISNSQLPSIPTEFPPDSERENSRRIGRSVRSNREGSEKKLTEKIVAEHDVAKVVSYVEKNFHDDRVIGRALKRVVRLGSAQDIAAFISALVALIQRHHRPGISDSVAEPEVKQEIFPDYEQSD